MKKIAEKHFADMVSWRRKFYSQPELGRQEIRTQREIMAILAGLGLSSRKMADTGVVCDIEGVRSGKTVAVRADMDALPVEDALQGEYRSQIAGLKHACGHDGHMAMLLGIAAVMKELQQQMTGKVRLIFQPDEEGRGGAARLIEEGAMEGVDYVLGAHLWPTVPLGEVGITYGPMMASSDEYVINIKGRGGHASMPQDTADALHIGVQIVTAIKQLRAQNIDPLEPALVAVGSFHAGETFNVLPDSAVIRGSIRSYDEKTRNRMIALMKNTVEGIGSMHGAESQLEIFPGYLPVVNDRCLTELVKETGEQIFGAGKVKEYRPSLASEDFSYYQREAPGCFIWLGMNNGDERTSYPLHHPSFDIDERALLNGAHIMSSVIAKLLNMDGGRENV